MSDSNDNTQAEQEEGNSDSRNGSQISQETERPRRMETVLSRLFGAPLTIGNFEKYVIASDGDPGKEIDYDAEESLVLFQCPNCEELVCVAKKDVSCGVFRHGIWRSTNMQIPPHTKEEECKRLVREGLIYGCGKPFRIFRVKNQEEEQIEDGKRVKSSDKKNENEGENGKEGEKTLEKTPKSTQQKNNKAKKKLRYFVKKCGYV